MNKNIIFISWTNFNRHSQLLAQSLGIEIFFIKNLIHSRKLIWHLFFWIDYLSKSLKTISIIWKNKPQITIVQNPPSILPILVIVLKIFKPFKLMIDSHNGAFEGAWTHVPFYSWALGHAEIVTIHNDQLLNRLKNSNRYSRINFKVLNSRLTDFSNIKVSKQETPYFLVVTTFSMDEPVKTLLEGIIKFCSENNSDSKFKLTGNFNKDYKLYQEFSNYENIEFLGYLEEQKYTHYLLNAYGIISLSTRDDVQQFAITEAISAEIPFISNINSTNCDLFGDKMILTEITAHSISLNINRFIKERDLLQENIAEIKKNLNEKWERSFIQIKNELDF